jgi:hypothetical protein
LFAKTLTKSRDKIPCAISKPLNPSMTGASAAAAAAAAAAMPQFSEVNYFALLQRWHQVLRFYLRLFLKSCRKYQKKGSGETPRRKLQWMLYRCDISK